MVCEEATQGLKIRGKENSWEVLTLFKLEMMVTEVCDLVTEVRRIGQNGNILRKYDCKELADAWTWK